MSILTVGYNPYANVKFSTTGPALPVSTPRRAFRSTAPTTGAKSGAQPCNLAQLLPEELRDTSVSSISSETNAWGSRSRSHQSRHNRRSSTTSVVSQPQNNWTSRSRTPECQNQTAAPLKVRKTKTAPKKTQKAKKQYRRTKEDNIRAIYDKGEKVGQLKNNVWYKAPKNGQPPVRKPARKNHQRPAAKKQSTVRRQAKPQASRVQRARASPETLKALKKLRKKVKQCTKIQERMDQGLRVEVNEVQKLKQLQEFKKQITALETQVSSGKAMDNQGFQKVKQRRR